MTKRCRFTADFKAKVALDALCGDLRCKRSRRDIKVHPNQVGTRKRQTMDSLGAVFANGTRQHQLSEYPLPW
jgi:transposase